MQDVKEPAFLEGQIEGYLLGPSKIREDDYIKVADHIFGQHFADVQEIKDFVQKTSSRGTQPHATPHTQHDSNHSQVASGDANPQATPHAGGLTQPDLQHHTPPPDDHVQEICAIVDRLVDIHQWTHNITYEEAPGYLSLGYLIVYFSKILSPTLDASYKCHPQRTVAKNINPGQNPSTDVALILKERDDVSVKYISRVLYEYKPAVGHIIQVANIKHLLELFLKCYYVMKYEKTSRIMGCLSDLVCWHFFELQLNIVGRMEVIQYTRLSTAMPPENTDVSKHLAMLMTYLK